MCDIKLIIYVSNIRVLGLDICFVGFFFSFAGQFFFYFLSYSCVLLCWGVGSLAKPISVFV